MTAAEVQDHVVPEPAARRWTLVRKRRAKSRATPIRGLAPLVALLALWQVFGSAESTNYPPPSTWWTAVQDLAAQGELFPAIRRTLVAFLIALVIATVLGTFLGMVVGRVHLADMALGPAFEFFRTLPAAAVLPVFLLLLGYTTSMKVSLAVFTSLWPVLLSVRTGALAMRATYSDVARTLGLSRRDRTLKIIIPSLVPSIATGLRIAAPLTLIVTLLAEMLTGVDGLGVRIILAQASFLVPQTYGLVLIAGVIALVVNGLVTLLERMVLRRYGIT